MTCKGCGEEKKLVQAHIIPESFFRDLRGEENTLKLISNTNGAYSKKAPIGIYDKGILCADCEQKFQEVDSYAAKLLIHDQSMQTIAHDKDIIGYQLQQVDYVLLKRFVISLLWRASISTHGFYKNVCLGELEEAAKKLIWEECSGDLDEFSFVMAKFDDTGSISKATLDPHPEEWFGRKYYRFYLGGFVLYIKADKQTTPEEWSRFIPESDNLVIISRGKIAESKEYEVLLSCAKE